MTGKPRPKEGLDLTALGFTAEEAYMLGLGFYNPRDVTEFLTYEEILDAIRNPKKVERDINKIISTSKTIDPETQAKVKGKAIIILKMWEARIRLFESIEAAQKPQDPPQETTEGEIIEEAEQ